MNNKKILIVDDSELNRALLFDMLEEQYTVEEAVNGLEAIHILAQRPDDFSLILLDIFMPEADGFAVLSYMKEHRILEGTAVIMISSDDSGENMKKAYEMGAFDYITRPFDATVVQHRVSNTMLLYTKQHRLEDLVTEQIYEQQKNNKLMISILSHIVEFRNGESGHHVANVGGITELLLRALLQMTDRYALTPSEIDLISTASALHDIGKISVPDEILNKPGRLTPEEFEIMKHHTVAGSDILHNLSSEVQEEEFVKKAYEICRWHHERYDGSGYPDGLRGDDIPISAQVVAMADVYDALTSERCYKSAYSHEQAIQMILEGQCGVFNPILLACLRELGDTIKKTAKKPVYYGFEFQTTRSIQEKLSSYQLNLGKRNMDSLSFEQQRGRFFSDVCADILFDYTQKTDLLSLNPAGAGILGLEEKINSPRTNEKLLQILTEENLSALIAAIARSSPNTPTIHLEFTLSLGGVPSRYHCIARSIWTSDVDSRQIGFVGALLDPARLPLNDSQEQALNLPL